MDQHQQQLQHLHATAEENLERKLEKICKKNGVLVTLPTISDFYHEREFKTHVKGIPRDYQLNFYFKYYNEFVASNFKARKDTQPFEIASAIWHYRLDKNHSFSRHHDVARVNVILATIVHVSTDRDRICNPATTEFREAFLDAWLYAEVRDEDTGPQEAFLRHWQATNFELVRFSPKQMKRVRAALDQLKESIPPMPAGVLPEDFLEMADSIDKQELRDNGPAWALQWVLHTESSSELFDDDADEDAMEDMMDMMGVQEEATQLSVELFQKPTVAGILTPINDNVIVSEQEALPARAQFWISTVDALSLLERSADQTGGMSSVTNMLASMKFKTG